MLFLFRIGDLQIRNKNGEQLDQAGETCHEHHNDFPSKSPDAMHLGNDTKASKLYSGRYALHDAKDPDIANFQHGSAHKTSAWLNALCKKALDVRGQKFDNRSKAKASCQSSR